MHSVEWLESIIRTKGSRSKRKPNYLFTKAEVCNEGYSTMQRWQKHFESGEAIHAIIKY